MESILRLFSNSGVFPLFILVFVCVTFVVFRFATSKIKRLYSAFCMCIWGFGLLYVTWLSRTAIMETRFNLIPFQQDDGTIAFDYITNIVMFIPFPMLLYGILQRKMKMSVLAGAGIGLSLAIELLQLITHRGICDIDDFLLNSIGAIIGAVATGLLMKSEKQR
ncbi:MAG: VanZ family protein [Candidatus Limivicinus sp.]|nr:VanZ family protein [Candidatus Limivicinus sp.]